MLNLCSNKLIVCGDRKEMDQFLELSENSDGLFELDGTYKMPKILENSTDSSYGIRDIDKVKEEIIRKNKQLGWKLSEEELQEEIARTKKAVEEEIRNIKETGFANRYKWRINNWGPKWDVYGHIEDKEDFFEITFGSLWLPPINWLKKVAKDFPELKFMLEYKEGECNFKGAVYACGEVFEIHAFEIKPSELFNDLLEYSYVSDKKQVITV